MRIYFFIFRYAVDDVIKNCPETDMKHETGYLYSLPFEWSSSNKFDRLCNWWRGHSPIVNTDDRLFVSDHPFGVYAVEETAGSLSLVNPSSQCADDWTGEELPIDEALNPDRVEAVEQRLHNVWTKNPFG